MTNKKTPAPATPAHPEVIDQSGLAVNSHKELSPERLRARINKIQELIADVLVEDVHYGIIPGTRKRTLYKAGAEYLMLLFGLHLTDVEAEDISGKDEVRYRVTTRLRDARGFIIATGVGECSSSEEKYAWRAAVCDEEWEDYPEHRRRKKWKQSGDCIKQVSTTPADQANTVLKMAKKRSMIDVVLTGTAASDCFEQDMEEGSPASEHNKANKRRGSNRRKKAGGKAQHIAAIQSVKVKKTGGDGDKAWTIWTVTAEDGKAFDLAFDKKLHAVADELAGTGVVVSIEWESTQYGPKLLGITDHTPQTPADEPPPPDDGDALPPGDQDTPEGENAQENANQGATGGATLADLKAEKERTGLTWDDIRSIAKKAGVKGASSKSWKPDEIARIIAELP